MRIFVQLSTLCLLALASTAQAKTIYVVANSAIPISGLSQEELENIYLLREPFWPDGNPIVPINREASSDLRAFFSEIVLKQSPRSLSNYWNQMHFRGKSPPIVQASDESVVAFVRKVPGAIGYVENPMGLDGVKIMAKLP